MGKRRKRHDAGFKARVASDAIREIAVEGQSLLGSHCTAATIEHHEPATDQQESDPPPS